MEVGMTQKVYDMFNDLAHALRSDDRDCDISFLIPIFSAAQSGKQLSPKHRMELTVICDKYEIEFAL
jgi:hypothetical protein